MKKYPALIVAALGSAVALVIAAPTLTNDAASPTPTASLHTLVTASTLTDKVLVIVAENHALSQFKTDAPFTMSLGTTYGSATNMVAATHPSKPNYAVMALGETKGITSDSGKTVKGPSVFSATVAAGRTAKTMAESMGTDRCRTTSSSLYVPRHNPDTFISTDKPMCEKYNFDYGKYGAADIAAGKLANVEFLIPNQCNNGHSCSLKTFDAWMKKQWPIITAGKDWQDKRLTVIITADEDDKKHGNVIPLIVANPGLDHKVVTTKLTLYSLNRLLTDFGHAPHMAGGKTAPDMAVAFGLNVS
jgi:phosphatidylinositol-3-phosphatase